MFLHLDLMAVLLLGVVAGTLGGVIGFGSSIMLPIKPYCQAIGI